MAEKAKKTTNSSKNKNIIICACVAVVAIVVIIVAIVLATRGGVIGGLNDAYFVSDGTKYVLNLDTSNMGTDEEDETAPVGAHLVYYYSGDTITDMKGYYEFKTEEAAKAAYEFYSGNNEGEYKSVELDGKYVILTANETDYEGLTATDVKQQIETIEQLQNAPQGELEGAEVEVDEVVETEPVEEVQE